ncbi:hypothetical protein Tco_0902672 [Tanacetum coccineum]
MYLWGEVIIVKTVSTNSTMYHGPYPRTHGVSKTDFERYCHSNDVSGENHAKTKVKTCNLQMANLNDMLSKFVLLIQLILSGSGTLPGLDASAKTDEPRRRSQPHVVLFRTRNTNPEPNVAPALITTCKALGRSWWSINTLPYSYGKISLFPTLTPNLHDARLADRSITDQSVLLKTVPI